MKNKNYTVISNEIEKVFDKIQHSLMTKTLQKVDIERTYLNIIKAIHKKPTVSIIFNVEKLKVLLRRLGTKQGCPLSTFIEYIILEVSAMVIREEKEIKGIQIGKEVKLSLFADDMILLYIENPKDAIRKLSEFINEFGKVVRYKINQRNLLR